jgi:uncharacterized protein (DUF433 family)
MPAPTLPAPRTSTMLPPTLADPAACDGCTLVPGSLQRVLQMAALREQGWSLDEIALRYEVSRERVRQILRAHGGPEPQERRPGSACRRPPAAPRSSASRPTSTARLAGRASRAPAPRPPTPMATSSLR